MVTFFAVFLFWAPRVQAQDSLLVTVDWLAQHLEDSNLVLLHVGEPQEFESAHIPGAQLLARQSISTPAGSLPVLELPPSSSCRTRLRSSESAPIPGLWFISVRTGLPRRRA